eukprot:g15230.t1
MSRVANSDSPIAANAVARIDRQSQSKELAAVAVEGEAEEELKLEVVEPAVVAAAAISSMSAFVASEITSCHRSWAWASGSAALQLCGFGG